MLYDKLNNSLIKYTDIYPLTEHLYDYKVLQKYKDSVVTKESYLTNNLKTINCAGHILNIQSRYSKYNKNKNGWFFSFLEMKVELHNSKNIINNMEDVLNITKNINEDTKIYKVTSKSIVTLTPVIKNIYIRKRSNLNKVLQEKTWIVKGSDSWIINNKDMYSIMMPLEMFLYKDDNISSIYHLYKVDDKVDELRSDFNIHLANIAHEHLSKQIDLFDII